MNDVSILQSNLQTRFKSRSMGLKLIVVCGLALLMTIPAFFVGGLVDDRSKRAEDVVKEIGGYVGGQQTFLGPTLAIPYSIPAKKKDDSPEYGVYLVFPAHAAADVKLTTEERRRSLFKVPVFHADLKFNALFDLSGVPAAAPENAVLDWNRAEFVIGVSDVRGAQFDTTLTAGGKISTLIPAQVSSSMTVGQSQENFQTQPVNLTLLGARAADIAKPNAQFSVSSTLRFSGAQRIAILAYGKTTNLSMQGDWPSPGFDGGFLPINRTITPKGFSADWSVPFIARGVRAEGTIGSITGLEATALGVSFVEVADPYQSVNRALKYVLLFLGLLFLSYFIFEVTTRKRVHPAQYLLVGMAQIIFYLLLLSFAERIGFDFAYLLAGGATVALFSFNAAWIFASRLQGLRALLCFSLLYSLIYLLLRLEDNALLVGAVASFLAVAAAMYFTRKIDWYSSLPASGQPEEPQPSVVPKSGV
jgi:inner membrane protein